MKRISIALVLVLVASGAAQASFPGGRGRIAYEHDKQIFTAEPNGEDVRQLTSEGMRNMSPAWSADGSLLAYSCTDDLCVMNADGTESRTLTGSPYDEGEPAWSPDGEWLVYTRLIRTQPTLSYERHEDAHIYKLAVNETDAEPRQLTRIPSGDPEWSPNGRWIVFKNGGWSGYQGVWKMRPDGTDIKKVTDPYNQTASPAWSPNGRWIAFAGKKRNRWRLAIVRPDGSGLHEIGFFESRGRGLVWSPDGERLLFTCTGYARLCSVRRDGTGFKKIAGLKGFSADWQPL